MVEKSATPIRKLQKVFVIVEQGPMTRHKFLVHLVKRTLTAALEHVVQPRHRVVEAMQIVLQEKHVMEFNCALFAHRKAELAIRSLERGIVEFLEI